MSGLRPGSRPALFDGDGRPLPLGDRLSDSGEAVLFRHAGDENRLIKLHHQPTDAQRRKLASLPALAPDDPSLGGFHRNYAWPVSVAVNSAGDAVGVVVPAVPQARSLTALANPKLRARRAREMNFHFLHAVAANVAFLVDGLHDQGYVIGDIKPDNVLIDDRALATLIDCDSIQATDSGGTVHLCSVGSEGFTAPEWIGRRFTDGPRDASTDAFALAVLLYQLLTGAHPWTGEWMGGGDPPPRDRLIKAGDWPFRPGARLRPVAGMVTPDDLAPGLAGLFRRAFIAGIDDPAARPSAGEWHEAVCIALADLEPCSTRPHHHVDASLPACPWCARIDAGLPDPFPCPTEATDPFAPLVLAFERALSRGDARMAVDLWTGNPHLRQRDDLARLRPRMAELQTAIDSLDRWKEAVEQGGLHPHDLAALADDLPALSDPAPFRHETVAGQSVAHSLAQVAEASVAIPPPPVAPAPCRPASTPLPAAAVAVAPSLIPVPVPNPVEVAYRVEAGWQGLRPAQLLVTADGAIPALVLQADETDQLLATIPAQRVRGKLSIEFDQPEGRTAVSLHTAQREDRTKVAIRTPPKRARTLGGGATLLQPSPLLET